MGFDKVNLRNWAGRIFSHFSCLPTPLSARVCIKQSSLETKVTYSICSKWKQVDSCRNDCLIMDQEYSIFFRDRFEAPELLCSSSEIVTSFSSFCSHAGKSDTLLWDIEQGHLRALFVEYAIPGNMIGDSEALKASAAIPGTFVHLFCLKSGKKLKTIQLPTENSRSSALHGKVHGLGYPSVAFASCRFCPANPYKIVYLAESARTVGGDYHSKSAIGGIPESSPFMLEENWGEGLSDTSRPAIFLLDLDTEEVVSIQPILEKLVPEAKHWSYDDPHYTPGGDGIVFVAYDNNPYRLGLKYCHQRAARLMYLDFETSTLQCLSHDGHAVQWPRFSPDGSKLVWFEMPAGGPHEQCFAMLAQEWPPNQSESEVIVPLIANVKGRSDFPGLYLCSGVPERCWTADSKGVILSTIWGAEKALIHVSLDSRPSGRISRFPSPLDDVENGGGYGTVTLMDINDDVLVVGVSSPTVPNFLAVAKVPSKSIVKTSWLNLNLTGDEQPIVPYLNGLAWKVLVHVAKTEDTRFGVTRFESILIYPLLDSSSLQFSEGPYLTSQEVTWESTRGLIVFPHGGPHSAFTAEWLPLLASYIAAGFACLLVNYRGSVGYGNSSIYSLPGQCGIIDVADCVQATEEALSELNKPDLPCVLFGGSHGGFLVLHLASRYASLYRAVVARNPVTNLVSMLSTTDIPDWCWTEAGIGLDNVAADPQHPDHLCRDCVFPSNFCPTDPDHLTRLVACSPIIHISSKWSVPILMCIGAKDRRVPNEQGISFMRALQAHLGEGVGETMCQTLCFPTEGHPIQSPAASKDSFVRAVEWYYQALGLLKA